MLTPAAQAVTAKATSPGIIESYLQRYSCSSCGKDIYDAYRGLHHSLACFVQQNACWHWKSLRLWAAEIRRAGWADRNARGASQRGARGLQLARADASLWTVLAIIPPRARRRPARLDLPGAGFHQTVLGGGKILLDSKVGHELSSEARQRLIRFVLIAL